MRKLLLSFFILLNLCLYPQSSLDNILSGACPGKYFMYGDYDEDGDTDIIQIVRDTSLSVVFRNDNGVFSQINLPDTLRLSNCNGDFVDYDKDNDLDVILTGIDSFTKNAVTYLLKNENGTYTIQNTPLINVANGMVKCFDFNNDGYDDIILSGENQDNPGGIIKFYQNTGDGFTGLTKDYKVSISTIEYGDIDADQDNDIIVTGHYLDNQPFTKILLYDSSNYNVSGMYDFLPAVINGYAEFFDYDKDSHLDIIVSGRRDEDSSICYLYKNNNNTFSLTQTFEPVNKSYTKFLDVDADGDYDLITSGISGTAVKTSVYLNNSNNFSPVESQLPNLYWSNIKPFSINNETGILFSGYPDETEHVTKYFLINNIIR